MRCRHQTLDRVNLPWSSRHRSLLSRGSIQVVRLLMLLETRRGAKWQQGNELVKTGNTAG